MKDISILWFRKDLRLDDNLALLEASKHEKIYPIFIFDETLDEYKNIGEASHWWLENSLMKLKLDLDHKLSILNGKSLDIISAIIERYNVKSVYWNRCYEPDRIAADKVIKEYLKISGIGVRSFNASLLWEPWDIKNKSGSFYKVFTPFFRKGCLEASSPRLPVTKPSYLHLHSIDDDFNRYKFKFKHIKDKWYLKFAKLWDTTESSARKTLDTFLKNKADDYGKVEISQQMIVSLYISLFTLDKFLLSSMA